MKAFGHEIREDFVIEPGYTCVNHSSYGLTLKYLMDLKFEICKTQFQNPDKFLRFDYGKQLEEMRFACADFLGGYGSQAFITQSSSESFNSIIKHIGLTDQDTVLYSNMTYPMVQNTLTYMNDTRGVKLLRIEFTLKDLNNETILAKFEEHLQRQKIKVVCFDNITALPSIKMPIKELVNLCKKYDAISIIDAAHGAGIREINLRDIDPDFFYTNFNKWAFCPTGVNMLYMKEKYLSQMHHNNVSIYYGRGVAKEFEYNGTCDRSSYLTVKESIKFIYQYGLKNIIDYSENMAYEGAKIVASIWETELMIEDKNMHSAMVNVRLPHLDDAYVKQCQKTCSDRYNVIVIYSKFDGKLWGRFTGSIYNELSDYEYAGKCFLKVLKGEED